MSKFVFIGHAYMLHKQDGWFNKKSAGNLMYLVGINSIFYCDLFFYIFKVSVNNN